MIPDDIEAQRAAAPDYTHTIATKYPVDIPKPGQRVVSMLDETATPLVVIRVEPMLVCRQPDGSEVMLYAHEVEVLQ